MKQRHWLRGLSAGILALALMLTGCTSGEENQSRSQASEPESVQTSETEESGIPTLYIGTYDSEGNGTFTEYPFVSSGEVTPENLISAMAELTGWDLTLSSDDPVTSGKGGMTVSFAPESAIFTGPPEEQKDEFHVYSSDQLCFEIFDSIQKTLQENFSPVNPSALDVYYCTDGSTEIELPDLGVVVPIDEPYSHALFEQLLMSAVIATPEETPAETTPDEASQPAA